MKELGFTFELFEENCQKQGIANWIDGVDSYTEENRLQRDRYAEGYFMCMRKELDESIPKLEDELSLLRDNEAPLWQVGLIEGQIKIIKNILGVRSSCQKVIDE